MKKMIIIFSICILLLVPTISQGTEEENYCNITEKISDIDSIKEYQNLSFVTFEAEGACKGYTLISHHYDFVDSSAKLIDMKGKKIKCWNGILSNIKAFPAKMLSNGNIIVGKNPKIPNLFYRLGRNIVQFFLFNQYLVQMDWNGTEKWCYNNWDEIVIPIINTTEKSARQHHDFQREGNPVGYYAPGQEFVENGKTLILAKKEILNSSISDTILLDDVIYEVDWNGELTGFIWYANEHFEEFGFDEDAKASISSFPGFNDPDINWKRIVEVGGFDSGDYLHINSISRLGINKWYDENPELYSHFHPENIILDSRHANFIVIIDHLTGNVVWRVGPDYSENTIEGQKIGQIIGPHNAHMIPNGLPGAGNILVFDNGGAAGYGNVPGQPNKFRNYSRVIEFNPVTLDIIWEYSNIKSMFADEVFIYYWKIVTKGENHHFFSPYVSSAQRLINGNTLITEGFASRVFEVNQNNDLLWEYGPDTYLDRILTPYYYRAYRIPPEWVPGNVVNYELWENITQNVNGAPNQNTQIKTSEVLEDQEFQGNPNSSPTND